MVEYNDVEKQALAMMQRTDFKNLSKTDVISIFSQLSQLRPEVASQVLAQFPEFVKLVQSSMAEYKEILAGVIASDDESIKQVFSIAEKDIDDDALSRQQFYDFAGKVHSDLSKCLSKPDITPEEEKEIREQEMEIFRAVNAKDTEIRSHKTETVKMVDKKDSEKRQFNWGIIKVASGALAFGLVIGVSLLGGNVNIKLPKKLEGVQDVHASRQTTIPSAGRLPVLPAAHP